MERKFKENKFGKDVVVMSESVHYLEVGDSLLEPVALAAAVVDVVIVAVAAVVAL